MDDLPAAGLAPPVLDLFLAADTSPAATLLLEIHHQQIVLARIAEDRQLVGIDLEIGVLFVGAPGIKQTGQGIALAIEGS